MFSALFLNITPPATHEYPVLYFHGDVGTPVSLQNSLKLDYLLEDIVSVQCSVVGLVCAIFFT